MENDLNREVELKLRADIEGLGKLKESEVVRQHGRAALRVSQLFSTYYDTPDHRLAARGLALRVRDDGSKLVQTLKAARNGGGAAHDRSEWEVEVASPHPELAAFRDEAVLKTTGLVLPDELKPFFSTRVRRETALVEWPDGRHPPSVVEVAFDQGSIEAGGRQVPLAEVELELKEGRPEALFGLAEAMRKIAPLAIETVDKARRGYRLATSVGPRPHKAGKVALAADCTVEDGLDAILRNGLSHWLDNEAPARDGDDHEGVHQLRVALRRLRSALAVFKDVLAPKTAERWHKEFRWLLGELGPARDIDVLVGDLLPPLQQQSELGTLASGLREIALASRRDAYWQLEKALASARYADLGLDFAGWVERRGWREGVDVDVLLAQRRRLRGFAAHSLGQRHRKVRKRGRRFAELDPAARHKVRIALKKLRYGVDYFAALFEPKEVRHFAKHLSALQDQLGQLNDVAVARRLVAGLIEHETAASDRTDAALAAGAVIGWQASGLREALPTAIDSWRKFKSTEPFWTVRP